MLIAPKKNAKKKFDVSHIIFSRLFPHCSVLPPLLLQTFVCILLLLAAAILFIDVRDGEQLSAAERDRRVRWRMVQRMHDAWCMNDGDDGESKLFVSPPIFSRLFCSHAHPRSATRSIVDPNRVDHTRGGGGDEREDDEHESASLVKH